MQKGDVVKTPRFLSVKIAEVFDSKEVAYQQGFHAPTHYWNDPEWDVLGKHTGENRMVFAAVKKERR